jgi:alkylation response protein AidB-like acyl-CoA dehydrogenase
LTTHTDSAEPGTHRGRPAVAFADNPIGLGMAAPTIAKHGTAEQQERFLPALHAGEVWCQLFSEPGAGSDLATLRTRAVRDEGGWIVNGQKVWTTLGHLARWGLLLARTDPDVPKHRGLTYFICDMQAPGVEVRPLRQMTGDAEFNEVFLSDVWLGDDLRLGDVGDGWRIATTTLMNERVVIGGPGASRRGSGPIARALEALQQRDVGPVQRDQFVQLWIQAEVTRLTKMRASQLRRTGTPGPEGSVAKLAFAELNQRITEFCVNVLGPEGQLYPDGYEFDAGNNGIHSGGPQHLFLRARANSIEGGTSEILRNILAERVLQLPAEPRPDRDVPWHAVPRG